MQTFLSEPTIRECAKALDNKRLNKQILEGYQILKVLSNASPSGAWRNHPAVLMWKNHEHSLMSYIKSMVVEAKLRGIKTDKNESNLKELEYKYSNLWGKGQPKWFLSKEHDRVIATHRANLYNKDPEYYHHYKQYVVDVNNEPCCERCKYYWPTHVEAA